jgi:hypothetical protein
MPERLEGPTDGPKMTLCPFHLAFPVHDLGQLFARD